MNPLTSQIIAFVICAGIVGGLTKLLRCKPIDPGITNPKKSSVRALTAVLFSLAILFLFEFIRRLPQIGILEPGAHADQIGYLVPAFIAFILFLLPAGIFTIRAHEPFASVGISRTNLWQSAVIGSVFVILMFYMQNVDPLETVRGFEVRHGIRLVYFAFVGFEEEILFRGYLQSRLIAWLGKWQGWGLASVIMAIGHFPLRMVIEDKAMGAAFIDSLGFIPISLFFGFVMLRTKNVLAPAIMHTFTNWISELN